MNNKPGKNKLAAALAMVLATGYANAFAEGESVLEEMVIKSDKPAVPANVPNTVESVTTKKIEENINSVTTAGLLQYLPSVHVRERYVGDVNGILVMRVNSSISSAQTTVYVDDLLISNFLNNSFSTAPRWGMVSPDEIERIDVMYGPFSALYPGNSAGGVVNITTRMPAKFEAHVRADYFTQHFKEYGTHDDFSGWHSSASIGSKAGDWSYWLDFDHLDNHGHPMTFSAATKKTTTSGTPVTGALFDIDTSGNPRAISASASADHNVQNNGKIKIAYDFSPTVRATYALGIWDNSSDKLADSYLRNASGNVFWSGTALINGSDYTVTSPSVSRQEATTYLHGLSLKSDTGGAWDWAVIASLYDVNKEATRTSSGNTGTQAPTDAVKGNYTDASGTGWWNIDLRGDWRSAGNRQSPHIVSFGYHRDRYTLETDTYSLVSGSSFYTSDINTLTSNSRGETQTDALYLQDAWTLSPDLKLVVGGRAERWQAFDGSNYASSKNTTYPDRTVNAFSPKASLTWQASNEWVVHGSIGKGVRFPTVSELFATLNIVDNTNTRVTDFSTLPAPYNTSANDPTLKPEKVVSSELAVERAMEKGLVRVSLFHEDKTDALISQTDTTTLPGLGLPGYTITSIQNVDNLRTDGIEVSWALNDALIHGLDLEGSVTYVDSVIEGDSKNPGLNGTDQPRIPHKRATLVATYHASEKLSVSLAGRYSGHQHNALFNTKTGRYDDVNPDVYGAVSQYKVLDVKMLYKFDTRWSGSMGINNLNNYHYYVNPNPYPQRTYYVGMKFDY